MKAFQLQGGFGLDHIVENELPEPVPGPGQVLIKMKAVSLNYKDLLLINGQLSSDLTLPFIPVSDGVGTVVSLGDHTSRFKVGDRVCGIISQGWISGEPTESWLRTILGGPLSGVLSEYVVLPEEGLVRVPDYLTDEEAAALPCAGVTAWHAVVSEGNVKADETVVVQGTGGVSLFALQFAKLHGATVIVTSSSDEKLERAKKIGADFTINYRQTPDWNRAVMNYTDGRGADHVIDLGGAATLNRSVNAVRLGGKVSIVGILTGDLADGFNLRSVYRKKVKIQGINVGNRDMFESMNKALGQNKLRPVIDHVFPFGQSVEALKYLASGAHFGKVCIRM